MSDLPQIATPEPLQATTPAAAPVAPPAVPTVLPDELRDILGILGWTQGRLATELGCTLRTVQRWAEPMSGYAPPESVSAWLRRRRKHALRAEPPPTLWLRRRPREGSQRDDLSAPSVTTDTT